MKSLVLGVLILGAALLAILPAGLGWGGDVLVFLRGGAPVLALFISMVAVFVGVADIKDRAEAKKEEAAAKPEPSKREG